MRARPARLTTIGLVMMTVLWLALYAQWVTIVPIVVPDQVAGMVAVNAAKEGISGSIIAAGAAVALVVVPIAGALSDRLQAPRGRRRPFLLWGMLGTCVSLLLSVPFGPGSSIVLYTLAILNLQFWWNWAAGPYAGLVPDVVPVSEQSLASGWINVMTILGTIAGNLLMALLYRPGHSLPVIVAFISLNLVGLGTTLFFVAEPPAPGAPRAFDWPSFLRSFWLDPKLHRNFYWVLITRLMANMGVWSVFTFMLFYIENVVGIDRTAAAKLLPELLGAGAVLAIPASLIGIRLADRHGAVRLVQITSWIMSASAICYVLIAARPSLMLITPLVLVFSAAYGAYGAVDWALALKVLPAGQDVGKDMGIWHVCMVLPQMLGPALTGWLISGMRIATSARLAYAAAFALAAIWFTLAAVLIARVRLPERAESLSGAY